MCTNAGAARLLRPTSGEIRLSLLHTVSLHQAADFFVRMGTVACSGMLCLFVTTVRLAEHELSSTSNLVTFDSAFRCRFMNACCGLLGHG